MPAFPHPRFLYLEVAGGDPALLGDSFALFKTPRHLAEIQFLAHNLTRVERQDLVDGRRVYRVISGEQDRLPEDNLGPYLVDTSGGSIGKLRFTETDPSEDQAVLNTWKNTRS